MKTYLFVLFFVLVQPAFSSDWTNTTFKEDADNQYWVGVSNPHDNLKDSINEAYNEAIKEAVKFNYGFNQSLTENYYSNKTDTSFQQESSFDTREIQFKNVKPTRQEIREINNKYIVFKEIVYPKKDIELEKNRLKTISIKDKINNNKIIPEQKFFGSYTVETEPVNSNIMFVNDRGEKFISTSGKSNVLPIGQYNLIISQNGFIGIERSIIVTGENTTSKLILEKQPVLLFLDIMPKDAKISIDGKIISDPKITLTAGLHEIAISKDNFLPEQRTIDLQSTDTFTATLRPISKSISIISQPSDADVFINGEFAGKTPLIGVLSKQSQTSITLVKEGFKMENKYFKEFSTNNEILKFNLVKLNN